MRYDNNIVFQQSRFCGLALLVGVKRNKTFSLIWTFHIQCEHCSAKTGIRCGRRNPCPRPSKTRLETGIMGVAIRQVKSVRKEGRLGKSK